MSTKINAISTKSMPNGAHFTYMEMAIERIESDETIKTKIATELANLKSAFEVEDDCLKVSQKSPLTDRISVADTSRDGFFAGYKSTVKGFLKMPAGELLEAALALDQHLTDYKIDTRAQLDRQTGMMTNFIADLETTYASQIAALGLGAFVTNMKAANDEVRELLAERDTANAAKTAGATRAARQATDDAYRAAIEKVNAYALIEGPADYQSFIDGMNAQIARYKREVLGQTSSSTTPTPETPEDPDPEDPESPDPETPETPDPGQGGESGTPEGV